MSNTETQSNVTSSRRSTVCEKQAENGQRLIRCFDSIDSLQVPHKEKVEIPISFCSSTERGEKNVHDGCRRTEEGANFVWRCDPKTQYKSELPDVY